MKSNRIKLIVGLIAVLLCFFAITFSKNWGTAVAEKNTEDFAPTVKSLKGNYLQAVNQCPKIIKKLEKGLPELQKNNASGQLLKSYKLIADCQAASRQFEVAAKSYTKLLEAEPQVARWHAMVAENLLNANKLGDALPASHLAVQLEPNDFNYRLLEARVLAKLKLTNRAIAAYHEAIRIAPYTEFEKTQAELDLLIASNKNNH
jgi:tetratricopeptide (TPR) repeat protein